MGAKNRCGREYVALSLQTIACRLRPQIIGCSEAFAKAASRLQSQLSLQ